MDSAEAYVEWVVRATPDQERQIDVSAWIDELQVTGPPSVVGYSGDGLPLARGPHDLLIEFTVIPKPLDFGTAPPYAIIGIRTIGA